MELHLAKNKTSVHDTVSEVKIVAVMSRCSAGWKLRPDTPCFLARAVWWEGRLASLSWTQYSIVQYSTVQYRCGVI